MLDLTGFMSKIHGNAEPLHPGICLNKETISDKHRFAPSVKLNQEMF
jgi:hypothetical protein